MNSLSMPANGRDFFSATPRALRLRHGLSMSSIEVLRGTNVKVTFRYELEQRTFFAPLLCIRLSPRYGEREQQVVLDDFERMRQYEEDAGHEQEHLELLLRDFG